MNKNTVKEFLYILIAITLSILAVKFIIWLLPVILITICSYHIYKTIKKHRTNSTKQKTKKKNIKIIDMVEDNN